MTLRKRLPAHEEGGKHKIKYSSLLLLLFLWLFWSRTVGGKLPTVPILLLTLLFGVLLRRYLYPAVELLATFTLLTLAIFLFVPTLPETLSSSLMAKELVTPSSIFQVDGIVVLSSSVTKDGRLSERGHERLLEAGKFFQNRVSDTLILTILPASFSDPEKDITETLTALNITPKRIAVGPVSSTHDEARLVYQEVKNSNFDSLLIITSTLHTARAAKIFQETFINSKIKLHFAAAKSRSLDVEGSLTMGEKYELFFAIIYEVLAQYKYSATKVLSSLKSVSD
jgi:hypothetical protein